MEAKTDKTFGELWDKFDEVYNRLTLGRRDLKVYLEMCTARQAAEERYAKELDTSAKKLTAPSIPPEMSSISGRLLDVKEVIGEEAKRHTMAATRLKEMMADLEKEIKDIKQVKTQLLDNQTKLAKDRDSKKATATRARQQYEEAVVKAESCVIALNSASGSNANDKAYRKLEEALQSAKRDLESKHAAYCKAVAECQAAQKKYSQTVDEMLHRFEERERERLTFFQNSLASLQNMESDIYTYGTTELLPRLSRSIGQIDIHGDIQRFVNAHYTGQFPEPHVEYVFRSSQLVGHFGDHAFAVKSKEHTTEEQRLNVQRYPTAAASHGYRVAATGAAPTASPAASSVSATGVGLGATATPSAGSSVSAGTGGVGLGAPGTAQTSSLFAAPTAMALYDYNSDEPDDLCFKADDIITLVSYRPEDEWWLGVLGNKQGNFPRDYVRRLDVPEITSAAAPAAAGASWDLGTSGSAAVPEAVPATTAVTGAVGGQKRVRALYDFTGQAEDELNFKQDDILTVYRDVDDWYEGCDAAGKVGMFPRNYVQDI